MTISMKKRQELVPLASREIWDQVNQAVKGSLFPDFAGTLRCFTSTLQSLSELALGTGQFLSHKKKISVFYGASPSFELLIPTWIREAVGVQSLKVTEMPQNLPSAQEWVAQLPKETSYVLFPEDHAVTAEVYPWQYLDEALNEKRIISIRLSHHHHLVNDLTPMPFSIRICVLDVGHIMALLGTRIKSPAGMISGFNWSLDFAKEIAAIKRRAENKKLVQEFEKQFVENQFLQTESRVFDRAVLCFPEINSDRLIQELIRRLGPNLENLSGTSLCSWSSYRMMSGWWHPEPTPNQLRGLLLIPAEALQEKNFLVEMKKACIDIMKEQSWVIPE